MAVLLRILRFPPVLILVGIACMAVPLLALELVAAALAFKPPEALAPFTALISTVLGTAGYVAFARWIERRPLLELRWSGTHLALGFGLGVLRHALIVGTIWVAGGVVFTGLNLDPDLIFPITFAVASAILSELALRGVVFRLLEVWVGSWLSLALCALAFVGLYMVLQNPDPTSALGATLGFLVTPAAAFMATRRLWLPIGLRIGASFAQLGLFGAMQGYNGVFRMACPTGSEWLRGGEDGPALSVIALPWGALFAAVFLALAIRRGNVVPWKTR